MLSFAALQEYVLHHTSPRGHYTLHTTSSGRLESGRSSSATGGRLVAPEAPLSNACSFLQGVDHTRQACEHSLSVLRPSHGCCRRTACSPKFLQPHDPCSGVAWGLHSRKPTTASSSALSIFVSADLMPSEPRCNRGITDLKSSPLLKAQYMLDPR